MNGTKKTLTTLTAAAALALGGIAIAQTTYGTDQSDATLGSSSTMQNTGDASLNNDTTLGSDSTLQNQDTQTLGAPSSDLSADEPIVQMDRN